MANSALIVLVAATLVLLLSAGDVDAEDRWTEEQVLKFYLAWPATIIAGPNAGSNKPSDGAFGSLLVFDVPVQEGLDNTSKIFGEGRGAFLIDSHDGTHILNFFIIKFTRDAPIGSVFISGESNAGLRKSVLTIIGGDGEFSGAEGSLVVWTSLPEGPVTSGQVLDTTFYNELRYKLRRH